MLEVGNGQIRILSTEKGPPLSRVTLAWAAVLWVLFRTLAELAHSLPVGAALSVAFLFLTALPAYLKASHAYDLAVRSGEFGQQPFGILLRSVAMPYALTCTILTIIGIVAESRRYGGSFWVALLIIPAVVWLPGLFAAGMGGLGAALAGRYKFAEPKSVFQAYAALGAVLGILLAPMVAALLSGGGATVD